jgi:hypothetical protein
LVSNTEFTKEPICTASSKYQKLKLKQLETLNLSKEELEQQREDVLGKECLCIGLSNAAAISYDVPFLKKLNAVTICPGPNIVNFSKITSLREMTDHIYGRKNSLQKADRPIMFIAELRLYIDFLKKEINQIKHPTSRDLKNWENFSNNLLEGIEHYRQSLPSYFLLNTVQFEKDLIQAQYEIEYVQQTQIQPLAM